MFFKTNDSKITESLLISFFLFLTLMPPVSIVSFILLTLYTLFTGKWKNSIAIIKGDYVLITLIGFYFVHVVGMLYSSDTSYGFADLQTKLSFLLVPVVYAGLKWTDRIIGKIKKVFVFSSVITVLTLLVVAAYHYSVSGNRNEFFYTSFSFIYHATYLTIYLNLALIFLQEYIFRENNFRNKSALIFLFFFIFTGVLLLSSRTSTFVTIFSLSVYPILFSGKTIFKNYQWLLHSATVLMMLLLFTGYLHFYNRFTQVEAAVAHVESKLQGDTLKAEAPNSTNIRLHTWKYAIQLITRNPVLGVGTGDLKEELVNIYTENNYEYGMKEKTSPHNQFLHTGVILGFMGIIFLLAYFIMPFFLALKYRDWLYVIFLVIILLNCMTESLFERQAGILFLTAFNTIFYLKLRSSGIAKMQSN